MFNIRNQVNKIRVSFSFLLNGKETFEQTTTTKMTKSISNAQQKYLLSDKLRPNSISDEASHNVIQ